MMIHVMDYFTDFILLPYLLVIPLSFVNSFDINDNYILNMGYKEIPSQLQTMNQATTSKENTLTIHTHWR